MEAILYNPLTAIVACIAAYAVGCLIRDKTKSPLANPLVIATALLILLLSFSPLSLEEFQAGGRFITMFIVPATTVLALQIARQWKLLGANILPLLGGCLAGSVTSIVSVWGMCKLFSIDEALTASLMPKSVTTAIALDLSGRAGGIGALTVSAVILTGILSAILSPTLLRLFKLRSPVAAGTAIGASGHAIGTARALEIGEVEGAMSGIALSVSGILTSVLYVFL